MNDIDKYEIFVKKMHEKFPSIFAQAYGGFSCGEGWWPILESLCTNIQRHIDWKNETREKLLKDNPYKHTIPEEVEQVVVHQIKEKFGGLRFYYEGGDDTIDGMVSMAESWACHSCETCGKPGKTTSAGWIKVACEEHSRVK
jgi:hypothetical protein